MRKGRRIGSEVSVGSCAHSCREQLLQDVSLRQQLRLGLDAAFAARGLDVRLVLVTKQHLHQLVHLAARQLTVIWRAQVQNTGQAHMQEQERLLPCVHIDGFACNAHHSQKVASPALVRRERLPNVTVSCDHRYH